MEVKLWFKPIEDFNTLYKQLFLNFVKPVIEGIEQKDNLDTFHFFFEPSPHFLLRIKPKDIILLDIKNLARKNLVNIESFIEEKPDEKTFSSKYQGEIEQYGEDGWKIAKNIFEIGSRVAIALYTPQFKGGKEFTAGKFVHCFLNSLGYGAGQRIEQLIITKEAQFYLSNFISRMWIDNGKVKMINNQIIFDTSFQEEFRRIGNNLTEKILKQIFE